MGINAERHLRLRMLLLDGRALPQQEASKTNSERFTVYARQQLKLQAQTTKPWGAQAPSLLVALLLPLLSFPAFAQLSNKRLSLPAPEGTVAGKARSSCMEGGARWPRRVCSAACTR